MGFQLLLVTYSLIIFSSPMPTDINWVEMLMGLGLTLAAFISVPKILHKANNRKNVKFYLIIVSILTIYPLFIGLICGNQLNDILRDIIPFLFMVLIPLIIVSQEDSKKKIVNYLAVSLVLVAVLSMIFFYFKAFTIFGSLDVIKEKLTMGFAFNDSLNSDSLIRVWRNCLIWIYDPSTLFAAIFLGAWGITLIAKAWASFIWGLLLLGISFLVASTFMYIPLRAYVFFYAISLLVSAICAFRTKGFYLRLIPVCILLILIMHNEIILSFNLILNKQQAVGFNGKLDEWGAVINYAMESPLALIFGYGWGAIFDNPIFLSPTRFTHSMISYLLLKGGILSLILLFASYGYIFSDFNKIGRIKISIRILIMSSLPIVTVGFFLEPIYKMLSYSIVIGLLFLIADQSKSSKSNL